MPTGNGSNTSVDKTCQVSEVSSSFIVQPKAQVPKWYLAYFFLAVFDVLTISGSLYLNHSIMGIFTDSVGVSEEWAHRIGNLSSLRELGGATNAPGNDVFDSHDVLTEAARLQIARARFYAHL